MLKHSKLDKLLGTLEEEELTELHQWLRSGRLKSSERERKLLKYWLKPPAKRRSERPDEALFRHLFPGEPYKNIKLRRLRSGLSKNVERYLVLKYLDNDEYTYERLLNQSLRERNEPELFQKSLEQIKDLTEQMSEHSFEYHRRKKWLLFQTLYDPEFDHRDANNTVHARAMEQTDHLFALEKFFLGMCLESRAKVFHLEPELHFFTALENRFRDGWLEQDTLAQLYRMSLRLLRTEDEHLLDNFEALLYKQFDLLPEHLALDFFLIGSNAISRSHSRGNEAAQYRAFRWHKFGIKARLFIQDGYFRIPSFSNIVTSAMNVNELEWAHQFVEEYQQLLPPDERTEEVRYAKVIIAFGEHKYHKVRSLLDDYAFRTKYVLKTKSILVFSYLKICESDRSYLETAESFLNAYETYLKRQDSWTPKTILRHLNLCRLGKRILRRFRNGESHAQIRAAMVGMIPEMEPISGRDWIMKHLLVEGT